MEGNDSEVRAGEMYLERQMRMHSNDINHLSRAGLGNMSCFSVYHRSTNAPFSAVSSVMHAEGPWTCPSSHFSSRSPYLSSKEICNHATP
jgi:hypothetical protein